MRKLKNDILIHPQRGKNEKVIPECGLLLVNPSESRIAMQMVLEAGGKKQFLFHSELAVSKEADFFVAGPSIGAPMATMTMEKLIVLGAKTILMYGWCGAVSPQFSVGDLFLGGAGHCGEGTSRYYSDTDVCDPSASLVRKIQSTLGLSSVSAMWTTDAVYRESRRMFQQLADKYNVCGVDMEYSALCAVAAFREIDFAGLFLVSDELWKEEWRPGFADKSFKKKSRKVIELLIQNIATFGK
jgi:purine-nucleoside phosphorylase